MRSFVLPQSQSLPSNLDRQIQVGWCAVWMTSSECFRSAFQQLLLQFLEGRAAAFLSKPLWHLGWNNGWMELPCQHVSWLPYHHNFGFWPFASQRVGHMSYALACERPEPQIMVIRKPRHMLDCKILHGSSCCNPTRMPGCIHGQRTKHLKFSDFSWSEGWVLCWQWGPTSLLDRLQHPFRKNIVELLERWVELQHSILPSFVIYLVPRLFWHWMLDGTGIMDHGRYMHEYVWWWHKDCAYKAQGILKEWNWNCDMSEVRVKKSGAHFISSFVHLISTLLFCLLFSSIRGIVGFTCKTRSKRDWGHWGTPKTR